MNEALRSSKSMPAQPTNTKRISTLLSILKISPFLLLFILSSSHERINPRVGKTTVEFYTGECRELLRSKYVKTQKGMTNNWILNDSVMDNLVNEFYRYRAFLPAWTVNFKANGSYQELILNLENAYYSGLNPNTYKLSSISDQYHKMVNLQDEKKKLEARINLEYLITEAAFKYIIQLSSGINNSDTSSYYKNFITSLPAFLNISIDHSNLIGSISKLEPSFYQYAYLKNGLKNLIDSVGINTYSLATKDETLNHNEVIDYLIKNGYLKTGQEKDSTRFANAVSRFQKYHGIKPTGKLDKKTTKHFSKSTLTRYYQIALNLDRLRKSSISDLNCIFVNIPEFKLKIVEDGKVVEEHKVMVGRNYTPTPEISSEIKSIIANPYWTVPKSITFNEMLPLIRKDSTYLKRNGFLVVDNQENVIGTDQINWESANRENFNYWIRQNHGRGNALGVLKFQFPNKHRIFIHDTQSKRLFERDERALSHGCIRLQNPDLLAEYLLDKYKMDASDEIDIKKVISRRSRRRINLDNPVPVHLKYLTCSADENGQIYYFNDIYAKDEAEIKELFDFVLPV